MHIRKATQNGSKSEESGANSYRFALPAERLDAKQLSLCASGSGSARSSCRFTLRQGR